MRDINHQSYCREVDARKARFKEGSVHGGTCPDEKRGLRPQPSARITLAGAPGFEPGDGGTKSRCLTAWPRPIG